MTTRITEYTIGELARASGVSIRTLRHYDATGLLTPAHVRPNGYRIYGQAQAERLQEILLYRQMGMGLGDIAALLDQGSRAERLRDHYAKVLVERERLDQAVALLEATLTAIEGDRAMTLDELYKPLSEHQRADYEAWLIETYGADMAAQIATSQEHFAKAPKGMEQRMDALREIEAAFVACFEAGTDAPAELLARHRDWIAEMWGQDCPPKAYAGLADLYQSHPDFIARYETLAQGFSVWLPDQMRAWAAKS